jgi:hypothetical protein
MWLQLRRKGPVGAGQRRVTQVSRKLKRRALSTYERVARFLLNKHSLRVPLGTAKMLAKTIRRYRDPPLKRYDSAGREHLQTARTAAKRIYRYTEHRVSHSRSIPIQCARLRAALDNPVVLMSLANCRPSVDWPQLLSELPNTADTPMKEQVESIRRVKDRLANLVRALDGLLSTAGKRTGRRPKEALRDIVRGGCIVWHRAGRSESYNNWEKAEKGVPADEQSNFPAPILRGPLIDFLRLLLLWCKVEAEDVPLHSAIKAARADPTIQRLAVHHPARPG